MLHFVIFMGVVLAAICGYQFATIKALKKGAAIKPIPGVKPIFESEEVKRVDMVSEATNLVHIDCVSYLDEDEEFDWSCVESIKPIATPIVSEPEPKVEEEIQEVKESVKVKRAATSNVIDLAGLDNKKAYDKAWRKAKAMGLDGKAIGKACVEALKSGATTFVVGESVEVKPGTPVIKMEPKEVKPEVKSEDKPKASDDRKKAYDFGWRKAKAQGADSEGCKASGKKAADMVKSGMTLDEVKAAFGVTPKAPKAKVEDSKPVEEVKQEPAAPVEEPQQPAAYEWKKGEKMLIVKTALKNLAAVTDKATAETYNEWFNGLHEDVKNYLRANEKFQAAHKAASELAQKTSAQKKNDEIKEFKNKVKEQPAQSEASEYSISKTERSKMKTSMRAIYKAMDNNDIAQVALDIPVEAGQMKARYVGVRLTEDGNLFIVAKTAGQKNTSEKLLESWIEHATDRRTINANIMEAIGKAVNDEVVKMNLKNNKKNA